MAFFADPRVKAVLRTYGFTVDVEAVGSRTMPCRSDLGSYAFAFPASTWAAKATLDRAQQQLHQHDGVPLKVVDVFESPLVVVTFTQVAEALRPTGAVSSDLRTFNVEAYLQNVFFPGKRWRDLSLGPPFSSFARVVLMSTRLDTSNSAELYLDLASQIYNKGKVQPPEAAGIRARLADLFRAQGSTGLSSDEPFEQFMSSEGSQLPLQVAYEAQFQSAGTVNTDMVLPNGDTVMLRRIMLYPQPAIVSTHAIAPFNGYGQQLADALVQDPTLRELEAEHGFRPVNDAKTFVDVVQAQDNGRVRLDLPKPQLSLTSGEVWDELVSGVANDVYGKDRAGVQCA